MAVEILVVGQLNTNCYLVFDEDSRQTFIIDPGDDGEYIIRKIHDLDLKPQAILATHGHFDHLFAGGSHGRTDFRGGDYQELQNSIKKILSLPLKIIIYPGHGEQTTVGKERKFYQK